MPDCLDEMADRHDLAWQAAMFQGFGNLCDERLQGVAAEKNLRDDLGIQAQLLVPGQVQQRLHLVRQGVHGNQSEESSDSLDGMKRPEDRMERLGIVELMFEGEQRRLDLLKMVERLGMKLCQQFAIFLEIEVEQHIDSLGKLCNCRRRGGLRRGVGGDGRD
jgi:hypothetical protein